MPSNDFHLMIESLHILLSEILAAGFEKSYFEAIWFINSPTGFPPATRSQLVSIPSKKEYYLIYLHWQVLNILNLHHGFPNYQNLETDGYFYLKLQFLGLTFQYWGNRHQSR
jgi:hypothetical protein